MCSILFSRLDKSRQTLVALLWWRLQTSGVNCSKLQQTINWMIPSWKMNIFNSLCVLRGLLLCCRDFKGDQLLAATGNDALGNIHCMLTMDENAHQLYDWYKAWTQDSEKCAILQILVHVDQISRSWEQDWPVARRTLCTTWGVCIISVTWCSLE